MADGQHNGASERVIDGNGPEALFAPASNNAPEAPRGEHAEPIRASSWVW